jgi:hypothetical protein
MKQDYFLSMDLDWCPDWILEKALYDLEDIPLTIFMTNYSRWIESKISDGAKWSLGLHPNFESGSSHGQDPDAIFEFLLNQFPLAISWRAHSLLNSNRVLESFAKNRQLTVVSNRYDPYFKLPCPGNEEFFLKNYLDLPIHFEDDLAMVDDPYFQRSRNLLKSEEKKHELVTVSFHPIHIYLNSSDMEIYNNHKTRIYSGDEFSLDHGHGKNYGIGDLFSEFLGTKPSLVSLDEVIMRYRV